MDEHGKAKVTVFCHVLYDENIKVTATRKDICFEEEKAFWLGGIWPPNKDCFSVDSVPFVKKAFWTAVILTKGIHGFVRSECQGDV
jgi:hypothetical protein